MRGLKEWEVFNDLIAIRTEHGWINKSQIEHGYRFAKIEGVVYEATFTCKSGLMKIYWRCSKKCATINPKNPVLEAVLKTQWDTLQESLSKRWDLKANGLAI